MSSELRHPLDRRVLLAFCGRIGYTSLMRYLALLIICLTMALNVQAIPGGTQTYTYAGNPNITLLPGYCVVVKVIYIPQANAVDGMTGSVSITGPGGTVTASFTPSKTGNWQIQPPANASLVQVDGVTALGAVTGLSATIGIRLPPSFVEGQYDIITVSQGGKSIGSTTFQDGAFVLVLPVTANPTS